MRGLVLLGLLVVAAPARADRTTAVIVGATVDARGTGPSFDAAGAAPVRPLGGARLTLSFEDAPVAIPAPGAIATGWRLAPELFAGFLSDDVLAEGLVGAGVRGELQLASHRRGVQMRTAIYAAARAEVIGKHQDGAAELAFGEYLWLPGGARFGWEGAALVRPRDRDGAHELDALCTVYVGWSR